MAAEVIAAVQVCASAYRFLKTAVQEGNDLNDMGRAIGKFLRCQRRDRCTRAKGNKQQQDREVVWG